MIILYCGIISIVIGMVWLIYIKYFESHVVKIPKDRYVPPLSEQYSEETEAYQQTIITDDDLPEITDIERVGSSSDSNIVSDSQEQENKSPIGTNGQIKHDIEYSVAFYIDEKGIIDTLNDGVKVPSDWSFLTRIGDGSLRYAHQGISITIQNKLYRFDFYRIEKLTAFPSYLLFTLKGKTAVYCIVLKEDADILLTIGNKFEEFNKTMKEDKV